MTKPIKILCVVTQMNKGGMESRLMEIYRNLDRSRIQFHFYTFRLDSGNYDEEIKGLGGEIYYSKPLSIRNAIFIPTRLKSFLINHPEYQIVHAHMNQWCGLILKGAKLASVPIRIAHSRTALTNTSFKNFIKNIIKIPTNKYSTHKFAVSKKAADWLFGRELGNEVKVVPNAIDSEKYKYNNMKRKQIREVLELNDDFALMHVGNIRQEKNHKFIIRIFKDILVNIPNSKLILVGKDHLNGDIHNLAKKMGIYNNIKFLGLRDDVADLLQAADVFVFPSLYEGLPGAVLEAQASGLPCVISDTITHEVIITPLVVQHSLEDEMNKWVQSLLDSRNIVREDTMHYFQENGFDIQSLSCKLTNFYEDVYKSIKQ